MNHNENAEKFGTELPVEIVEWLRDYCFHKTVHCGLGFYSMKQAVIDAVCVLQESNTDVTPRPETYKADQTARREQRISRNLATRQNRKKPFL